MSRLLVWSVFTLLLACGLVSAVMKSGSGALTVTADKEFGCKVFPFEVAFSTDNVHVQLGLLGGTYQATVTWVEQVSKSGFTGCVATSGSIVNGRTVSLQWLAYDEVPSTGAAAVLEVPLWTTGTKCVTIDIASKVYTSPPYVFLTAIHTSPPKNKHDATSVWAAEVAANSFRACFRELKNFDGIHTNVKVDWLTLSEIPSSWTVPFSDKLEFTNDFSPSDDTKYSFCKTVSFPNTFYAEPTLITTARHKKNIISTDNNAITEWLETVSTKDFKVCLKDIQRYDAHHDAVVVNFLAVGHYHPCLNKNCPFFGVCKATSATSYKCVCEECDPDVSNPLCDNNDVTHKSVCEFQYMVCQNKENPGIKHYGGCKPFILERGRVVLRLNTTDVQCRAVSYKLGNFEVGRGVVHVQTSINYFNYTSNMIHDAAVNWVEKVNISDFKVCALKAGRAERFTPDGGLVFIDYLAYQESPVGAVAGQISMTNWWDGTTCKPVSFPTSFSQAPYILLTAEHTVLGQKHDAATVWAENVGASTFKVCLREMQNFDGLHKDIKVNWFAYENLPEKMLAEKRFLEFPNDIMPKAENHNSYCQKLTFNKALNSTPTVIVSASHTSETGGLAPVYNSIASWVEKIGTTDCDVCIKELHSLNGYDPVKVTVLVVGS